MAYALCDELQRAQPLSKYQPPFLGMFRRRTFQNLQWLDFLNALLVWLETPML